MIQKRRVNPFLFIIISYNSHPKTLFIEDSFKLAAYGVKQGGIGSILAGGFSLKRTSTNSNRSSVNDRPTSTNTESNVSLL